MEKRSSAAFFDSKPHYALLDWLRGVAALIVIWYHVFEGFATSPVDQCINHGYLAVDFFFMLSGFVIGYAYDDRWARMGVAEFFKRRLIRLHPLVVAGAVLGLVSFCIQGHEKWDGTAVPFSAVAIAFVMTMCLIPSAPGCTTEVRGNGELFPLNGPSWSLFFEYIGYVLYAFFIHRASNRVLGILTVVSGVGLVAAGAFDLSGSGHLGMGWTFADYNFIGGSLRLLFSFSAGLLISRIFIPVRVKGAFPICSLVLIGFLSMPHVGGDSMWINGLYDSLCVIAVFPTLVYVAASGHATGNLSQRICKFLGDISYPVYIVHYPVMYLFYAWLWQNGFTFAQTWYVALCLFVGVLLLAYAFLKLYDEPIRRSLTRKLSIAAAE